MSLYPPRSAGLFVFIPQLSHARSSTNLSAGRLPGELLNKADCPITIEECERRWCAIKKTELRD